MPSFEQGIQQETGGADSDGRIRHVECGKIRSIPMKVDEIDDMSVHKTVENRDGHVQSGVDKGMAEGYARLDELLAVLLQTR